MPCLCRCPVRSYAPLCASFIRLRSGLPSTPNRLNLGFLDNQKRIYRKDEHLNLPRNILLPQPIEADAVTLLENANCNIILAPEPNFETVSPLLKGVQGIVLRTGIRITEALLAHADELLVISRTGGGLDNVDVEAAAEKEIIVTSNLGVNTSSVVEHALSMMLALSKQLPFMDRSVRNDRFGVRYKNYPRDLREKTLGLMGFGRIGSDLANACRNIFRMNIMACDPFLPDDVKKKYEMQIRFVDLKTLFSEADVISVHVPLTEDTRHIVGEQEISYMKPDAIIINTARGPVMDEAALVQALKAGRIGGAGLDVFEKEPVAPDNPLLKLDNVILTPHTAALTRECVIRMATEAAQCVIDVLDGKIPKNVANPQILKSEKWKHLRP